MRGMVDKSGSRNGELDDAIKQRLVEMQKPAEESSCNEVCGVWVLG